jgi:PAS domain S-box-containing protein
MIFRDIPIQQKLTRMIMLTCSVALLLMAASYIVFEYFTYKKVEQDKVATRSLIFASNSTAALAFDSPEDASEILNALHADKNVIAACLYDADGNLFAKYPSDVNIAELPSRPAKPGFHFKKDYIQGFQPVVQAKLRLGTFYIKSSIRGVYAQIFFNAMIAFILIGIILIVAYLLSKSLQKAISDPIISLEKTAKHISEKGDYASRAVKVGNDELGSLTDAFNHMLSRIEAQNHEILLVSEESSKLAAIVESSGDVIVGTSIDLNITSWNSSAERILGFSSEEMIGKPGALLFPSPHVNRAGIVLQLRRGQQIAPYETKFISKNGNILDVSLTISPVKNAQGLVIGISMIARDITVQKLNERKIIENEEHLRLATEAAELGTFDVDMTSGIINFDSRCRAFFEIADEEVITYNESFLKNLHTDDRKRVARLVSSSFDKEISGGNYDVECRTIVKHEKFRWIKAKGKVFFDEADKPVRFIGSVLDITNQKLEEAKKNDFIAIISHELKTPITVIKSYLQIMIAKAKKDPDNSSLVPLTRAEAQTNKMSSMIKDFLNLARIEAGKIMLVKEKFDLSLLLDDVVAEAHLLSNSHNIKLNYGKEISVYADKEKIGQVLINLVSNAIKYSPFGSTITIDCGKVDGEIKTSIKDEGVGISLNDQKELFTRFYRVFNEKTKTVSGFGIGLYIVSEILKQHNSEIKIESKPGQGATFSFCLDAVD